MIIFWWIVTGILMILLILDFIFIGVKLRAELENRDINLRKFISRFRVKQRLANMARPQLEPQLKLDKPYQYYAEWEMPQASLPPMQH